jgi:hypothetical protein
MVMGKLPRLSIASRVMDVRKGWQDRMEVGAIPGLRIETWGTLRFKKIPG